MLYQGVIRFTQRGITAVEQGGVAEAHAAFTRAQDIITELVANLNTDEGGAIAQNLLALYDFCYRELVAANCKKDHKPAGNVVKIFRELLTAWQEIANTERQHTVAQRREGLRIAV